MHRHPALRHQHRALRPARLCRARTAQCRGTLYRGSILSRRRRGRRVGHDLGVGACRGHGSTPIWHGRHLQRSTGGRRIRSVRGRTGPPAGRPALQRGLRSRCAHAPLRRLSATALDYAHIRLCRPFVSARRPHGRIYRNGARSERARTGSAPAPFHRAVHALYH